MFTSLAASACPAYIKLSIVVSVQIAQVDKSISDVKLSAVLISELFTVTVSEPVICLL